MFTFVLEAYIDDLLVARSNSPGFFSLSFDVCGDFPSKTSFPEIINSCKVKNLSLMVMNLIAAFYPMKNFKVTPVIIVV